MSNSTRALSLVYTTKGNLRNTTVEDLLSYCYFFFLKAFIDAFEMYWRVLAFICCVKVFFSLFLLLFVLRWVRIATNCISSLFAALGFIDAPFVLTSMLAAASFERQLGVKVFNVPTSSACYPLAEGPHFERGIWFQHSGIRRATHI